MTLLDAHDSKPLEGGPSFSWQNRLARVLWNSLWCLFASWTPAPFFRYRVALLRLFGAQVDWTAHVYGSARIWLPTHLTMEPHSCLGPRSNCYCMAPIRLESGAIVSQDATLCAASHDVDDPHFQLTVAPIRIGRGAWVAAEAFVGPGVTVGDGAVLGARSCLFKDAESRGIYVGNPAKKVRERKPAGAVSEH